MTRNRILTLFLLLLCIYASVEAQTQKANKQTRIRTTRVQKEKQPQKMDTIAITSSKEPKYKSISDPMLTRYLHSGFSKEKKLYLITSPDYTTLSETQKREILNKVMQQFTGHDITLFTGKQQREIWITDNNSVICLERWNNDSLCIEDYMPLELKRSGETKVFYYIGGMLNESNKSASYSLNLRAGSYLYKNRLDASATLNVGSNKTGTESLFAGDIGIDSRAYLPFRIKNVNLAPYAGAGVSWLFAPESYFELRILAGGCWFVGPGSLDIGLQYGTKSDFSITLGYTFRILAKKK